MKSYSYSYSYKIVIFSALVCLYSDFIWYSTACLHFGFGVWLFNAVEDKMYMNMYMYNPCKYFTRKIPKY